MRFSWAQWSFLHILQGKLSGRRVNLVDLYVDNEKTQQEAVHTLCTDSEEVDQKEEENENEEDSEDDLKNQKEGKQKRKDRKDKKDKKDKKNERQKSH